MPLLHIVYPALKSILVNRLQKILLYSEKNWQPAPAIDFIHSSSDSLQAKPPNHSSIHQKTPTIWEIPINRVQQNEQIWYVSALALKLAQPNQQPALSMAQDIAALLSQNVLADPTSETQVADPIEDQIWRHIVIEIAPPGWIYFKLTDRGKAYWLQTLVDSLPSFCDRHLDHTDTFHYNNIRNSTNTFPVLYSHARCCSLLRLGNQEKLIHLKQANSSPLNSSPIWHITDPHPLPWLREDHTFRCQQSQDHHLIAQIADTLDRLYFPTKAHNPDKLAQSLSHAFQQFYAQCQILGNPNYDPNLAQARLGLVLTSQTLLRILIYAWLKIDAPTHL